MRVGSCGVNAGSAGAWTLFQGSGSWAEARAANNVTKQATAVPQVRVLLLDANLGLVKKSQVSPKDGRTWGTAPLDITFAGRGTGVVFIAPLLSQPAHLRSKPPASGLRRSSGSSPETPGSPRA